MEKKEKNKLEKKTKQLIIIVIALIAVIGISYAWLTIVLNGQKTNVIKAGTLSLTLSENANSGINIDPAVPQSDSDAEDNATYEFTLTNNGNIPAVYTIYLDNDSIGEGAEMIQNDMIKYSLLKNGTTLNGAGYSTSRQNDGNNTINDDDYGVNVLTNFVPFTHNGTTLTEAARKTSGVRILDSGTIPATSGSNVVTYSLKLWIKDSAVNSDLGKYKYKVNATTYSSAYDSSDACNAAYEAAAEKTSACTLIPSEFAGKIRVDASQENIDVPDGSHVDYTNGQTVKNP